MSEDFNESPIAFEDKIKELDKIIPLKIEEIECITCKEKMRHKIKIKEHMKKQIHYSFKIKRNSHIDFEEVTCNICSESNINNLYIILNQTNIEKIKDIICCLSHIPKEFDGQPLMDFIEEEDIIHRKFNKAQLKYKDKSTYYNVLKPLAIADMIYQRNLYEKKESYEIELLENKRRYYFIVQIDFNLINITPGKILKFSLKEEKIPFEFLAVITKNEIINEGKYIKIIINPINMHISNLKEHTGIFKIKEGFCLIPYSRMMEALTIFETDFPEDKEEIYERAVSLYLTERIMGYLPFNLNSENKKLIERVNTILRIERNTVELILFKNEETPLIKEIKGFGSLNESQILALENIFKQPLNMIQGPPGTGKTFLSSFIIYNIFNKRKYKEDKILLCAPSNSAADNLTSCILRINKVTGYKMNILRIYSKTKEYLNINKEIEEISIHGLIKKKSYIGNSQNLCETHVPA